MISIPFASLLLFVATLSQTVQADWNPQCNTDYISDIPYDVFSGPFGNVYTQFCGAVNQYNAHQPVSWTVNRTGGQISNIPPAQADVDAASGPGPYSFTFDLSYTPTARQKICTPNHTCQQVYAAFANSCGHNGNNLNHMAHSGTFSCWLWSIYSYSIFPLKALGSSSATRSTSSASTT
ncbi:hypothetical protein BJ170DRAFT_269708 [Xylariales sp. AK1849]|nr:hypothetical protein BJ170DRAFT_269708 [Xylariales sp. AK1849]